MKNLQSYEEFLFEDSPLFGFDGCQLQVGKSVISRDGYSGIIVSKENVNGHVQYRDHKGVIRVCESEELVEFDPINEDLTWWEVTKGILAADAIRAGVALAGGGILIAGYMFANWRKSIANKMESIKRDEKYKELKNKAAGIADKFNGDSELTNLLNQLAQYPYTDTLFVKGKREKSKAESTNKERSKLMRDIAKYVKSKLTDEEMEGVDKKTLEVLFIGDKEENLTNQKLVIVALGDKCVKGINPGDRVAIRGNAYKITTPKGTFFTVREYDVIGKYEEVIN